MSSNIKNFFQDVFSVNDSKATKEEIKERIVYNSKLKGPNMWGLVFAIILASLGLNIGSQTVLIGAIMISPLMGGIQGIGYALATTDLKYLKRVFVGFFIEILICIITSMLYFLISPIDTKNSTFLLSYSPKIWDAIIAFVAGAAGILSLTRKNNSPLVLSGAAVAATIMPGLCKAGYGISKLDFYYVLNALYLFFINAFFICLATIVILKIMKIPRKRGATRKDGAKMFVQLIIITVIALIPSSIFAYQAINETILESNIKNYINTEFLKYETQVVKSNIDIDNRQVEVVLIGKTLDTNKIKELTEKLKDYDIDNMELKIIQTEYSEILLDEELDNLKAEILAIKSKLEDTSKDFNKDEIIEHIKKNYSKVSSCNITSSKIFNDGNNEYSTSLIVALTLTDKLTKVEVSEINELLLQKLQGQKFEIQYVYK